MEPEFRPSERVIDRGVRMLAMIGGYLLIWLMGLTVFAVFTRKVLNAPILGIQDLSEVSLVVTVFAAMAYAGWTGGHIAVDLIADVLSPRLMSAVDVLIRSISAIFFAIVAWQSALRAIEAQEVGEATNMIALPLYPYFWVIALGFALFSVVLAVLALRAARGQPDFPAQ